jgi:hypothetical protein
MYNPKKNSRKNKVLSLMAAGITILTLVFSPITTGAQSGLFFDPNAPTTTSGSTNYNSTTDYNSSTNYGAGTNYGSGANYGTGSNYNSGADYTSTGDYNSTTIFNNTGSYDPSVTYDPVTGTYTPSSQYDTIGTLTTSAGVVYQDRVTGFANREPTPIACDNDFGTMNNITLTDIMDYGGCIIAKSIIPLLMALAMMVFVYGVVKYVIAGDGSDDREEGRWFMIYGILGLFAMVSVWGLVILLANTVGIGTAFPQF